MELTLPAPCLVVLIGASGAGKTTWAREHFAANEVVSSDALRAMAGIDEDDQQASTVAFTLLEHLVEARLGRRLTTVIDTTGLNAEDRNRWLRLARANGVPAYAIVFDTPPAVSKTRNAEKPRPVPARVLGSQLRRFAEALPTLDSEGWDGVHHQQGVALAAPDLVTRPTPDRAPQTGHAFGLMVSRFDWKDGDLREQLASVAIRAERAGFRDLWVMDHFRQIRGVGRPWEDIPEAYTAISYVAGVTTTIRLGALVSAVTHRHPVVLGKMIATLDVLSGGRANCGLGAAWDTDEHAAYGVPMPDLSTRYALLEDTLEMLPLLWGKGSPRFEGRLLQASELVCYPRPIQEKIPILIGGSGETKTLRLVARHADACNVFGTPERVAHKARVLERHCVDLDRDPSTVEVTHLTTVLAAHDRAELRDRIGRLRDRAQTHESYASANNAGTVDDIVGLVDRYQEAGADTTIVAIPDVSAEGSIEAFGEVIAAFGES